MSGVSFVDRRTFYGGVECMRVIPNQKPTDRYFLFMDKNLDVRRFDRLTGHTDPEPVPPPKRKFKLPAAWLKKYEEQERREREYWEKKWELRMKKLEEQREREYQENVAEARKNGYR